MPETSPSREGAQYIFRATDTHTGRKVFISPENSSMKEMSYARTILDGKDRKVSFETGDRETGLFVLRGDVDVLVDGRSEKLSQNDAIYIPRGSRVEITSSGRADVAEVSAPVEGQYPLQVVRYAEVKKDPSLRFQAGQSPSCRTVEILIGKNVKAGRILGGITRSDPGNWTSWPPHEHAAMLEEIYVYIDMPPPGFGVQFIYTDVQSPAFLGVVRQGDAVVLPSGYHPNVAVPGHPIAFLWIMAAHREVEDRRYGVVNIQPEFDTGVNPLAASLK